MTTGKITLLLEHFSPLVSAVGRDRRFTSLETLLVRGRAADHGYTSCDQLRFALFGLDGGPSLPVAALSRMAAGAGAANDQSYCLRLDPVSLHADMTRVIMTRSGFADFDEQERKEIGNVVRAALMHEGMELQEAYRGCWTVALESALQFGFTPLEDALGMDLAEVLPEHPEALRWRRLLNDIQMALHACEVNANRRRQGRPEINSIWFWGGGALPAAAPGQAFQVVCSDEPLTRGLALLHGVAPHDLDVAEKLDFTRSESSILLDWSARAHVPPARQLERLEHLAAILLEQVKSKGVPIHVCTGGGSGWIYDRSSRRRWWKRPLPLAGCFEKQAG